MNSHVPASFGYNSVSQSGWRAPPWGAQSHAGGGAKHEVGLAVVHLHKISD